MAALVCAASLGAAPPPTLPGQEITGEVSSSIVRDTAQKVPASSPLAPDWLSKAYKTWDAPQVSQQLDEDETPVPLGKGGVFVPRFSDANLEPDVQILDGVGRVVASGKTGRKYNLVPGTYTLLIGSGSIKQRISKIVSVQEGKVIPLTPDWCGLQIEVVNEIDSVFRGPYEMARMDEFEPYGRSYGRDPNLGERIKTWILKPGLYKIFGTGESYNTRTNFVTVRLLPGEMTHFLLVQDARTLKIMGGGVAEAMTVAHRVTSGWKYGLDLGGSILFNTSNDTNNSSVVFLTNLRLNFKKGKHEWDSKIFFDEELSFTNLKISELNYTSDDFRVYSLYVWRFLHWFGPYARMQFETHFFPVYDRFDESSLKHLFLILRPDSSIEAIDSTSTSKRILPSLFPVDVELGVGTNIDVITAQNFDTKFKVGFGYSQRNIREKSFEVDTLAIQTSEQKPASLLDSAQLNSLLTNFKGNLKVIERLQDVTSYSYGPESSVDATVRLGRFGTAEGEVIVRIPILPIVQHQPLYPDWRVNTSVSWQLTRHITLDYLYQYTFSRPLQTAAQVDMSQHRIWLRFSFNSSR
jgi:hypothetical protein